MDLAGKTAVVTGGAVRLGRAAVLALAQEGVNVCLHYGHSAEPAEETLDLVRSTGAAGFAVQADFRDPCPAARTVIDASLDAFGRVDILVNNAAIFETARLRETTEDIWDRHFAINLKAPFFLARAFAEARQPGERGHIVNIADWRGERPDLEHLAYSLTKSGLITLTRALAVELAPGVQVNAVAPGAILPPPGEDESYMQRIAEEIPLRRTGSPEAITEALLWLLRSDFVTGEVVHVTGGEQL